MTAVPRRSDESMGKSVNFLMFAIADAQSDDTQIQSQTSFAFQRSTDKELDSFPTLQKIERRPSFSF